MVTCRNLQPVGSGTGCLGGAPGPPSLAHSVLSRGESNLRVSFAVEELLCIELLEGFVRGKLFVASVQGRWDLRHQVLHLGVDRFAQPSQHRSPSKTTELFGVNKHLYLDCARVLGVALMYLSIRMRYKTRLATMLSGVSFGLPARLRILYQVALWQDQLSRKKHMLAYSWFL